MAECSFYMRPPCPLAETLTKQEALTHLTAFKAKYAQRYPEAVRSLAEDEEHLLTLCAVEAQ
jgi:transposase-like protein